MRIKLRQVEGFLAAADALSFSRAAEKIGMTQPAFSQLIRDLEAALDIKLFDRSTRRVRITEAGLLLRDQMRRGLREIDNACNNARALTRLESGRLSLAVLPSLAVALTSGTLARFHQAHPTVKIRLQEARTPHILSMVLRYEVDFAICANLVAPEETVDEPLFDDELVVVLPRHHPLARARSLRWTGLVDQALIWLSAQAGLIRNAFEQNGIDKAADYEVLNSITALSMVRAGFGITIVPRIALPELNMRGLVYRPLHDPQPTRRICLYRRKDHALSPAAHIFRELLLAETRQAGEIPVYPRD